ncbi:MAG: glutamate--tRNA ligase family protein [Victivallales bacterium]
MDIRVRFAPSPTGHVHIGNIRTAIFDWLYARHSGGKFLLRVEDTDRERSTQAAIDTLLECMTWLGLDYDEEIFYQSKNAQAHVNAAAKMLETGKAYRPKVAGPEPAPVIFRLPWDTDNNPDVRIAGNAELITDPSVPVKISSSGIHFAQLNEKGKSTERSASLAGFHQLRVLDAAGNCLFEIEKEIENIFRKDASFEIANSAKLVFQRREIVFKDIIKGELAKPLDGMKDLVIVRGDGTPVFHLANVCDDVEQKITHIIRGDDHVENTYRHIFLFQAIGFPVPIYGHLPMIVNQAGKPYSKRDGDAYVGDFRSKGYLPDALFNYLSLLGWSPGDDREKMSRKEIIDAFTLERVKSSSAQFDTNKLGNMNGQYMAEMDPAKFVDETWKEAGSQGWTAGVDRAYFAKVAGLMQSRMKLYPQVSSWKFFFFDEYEKDGKAVNKFLSDSKVVDAIRHIHGKLSVESEFTLDSIQKFIREAESLSGIQEGKLNQPLRVAVTGQTTGAGIYETMEMLGREKTIKRLKSFSA